VRWLATALPLAGLPALLATGRRQAAGIESGAKAPHSKSIRRHTGSA